MTLIIASGRIIYLRAALQKRQSNGVHDAARRRSSSLHVHLVAITSELELARWEVTAQHLPTSFDGEGWSLHHSFGETRGLQRGIPSMHRVVLHGAGSKSRVTRLGEGFPSLSPPDCVQFRMQKATSLSFALRGEEANIIVMHVRPLLPRPFRRLAPARLGEIRRTELRELVSVHRAKMRHSRNLTNHTFSNPIFCSWNPSTWTTSTMRK